MAGVAGTGLKVEEASEEQQERRWCKLGQVTAINEMQIFEQHYMSSLCTSEVQKTTLKWMQPLQIAGRGCLTERLLGTPVSVSVWRE